MMQPARPETALESIQAAPGDPRQERIQSCQGMVRSIAWLIAKKLPPHVEMEDLVAYGQIGLAQASRDFDLSRGRHFPTYAYHRVRGAIYDGLAQMRWFRFSDYHGSKYEQMAGELMNVRCEGAATEAGWVVDTVSALAVCFLAGDVCDSRRASDDVEAPEELLSNRELHERLRCLIEELPSDARMLVLCVYYEGMSLSAAADKLQVSRSWASRLHARTLERLGRAMRMLGADVQ